MFHILGLDHLVLRVRELDTMLAFYCGALGCTVERRQDQIGLVQLRAGAALIDLVPVDGPLGRAGGAAPGQEGRNLDHFCLRVAPFDEAQIRQQLAAHGVEAGPVDSRFGAEGEGPSIYLEDPEGNVVELKGPPGMTDAAHFVSTTPVLASLDIERSVAFYCSRLGFTRVHVQQGNYGIVARGAVQIHFWACTEPHIAENTSCRVRVEGIDRLLAECRAFAIVHPNAPLQARPWGTREFGVLDPDGNLVTFAEWSEA
jgi:catechol 2,3-dioxygenase-like lactoylglutathione lyase family enzyme